MEVNQLLSYKTAQQFSLMLSEYEGGEQELFSDWAYDYNWETNQAELNYYGHLVAEGYRAYYINDVLEWFRGQGIHITIKLIKHRHEEYNYWLLDNCEVHYEIFADNDLEKVINEKLGESYTANATDIFKTFDEAIRKLCPIYKDYLIKLKEDNYSYDYKEEIKQLKQRIEDLEREKTNS